MFFFLYKLTSAQIRFSIMYRYFILFCLLTDDTVEFQRQNFNVIGVFPSVYRNPTKDSIEYRDLHTDL